MQFHEYLTVVRRRKSQNVASRIIEENQNVASQITDEKAKEI